MPIVLQCNVSENAVYICATQRMHRCFCITLLTFASYCFTASLLTVAACALMCQNGGTRNENTCTCDCADGYSGDTCGSECIVCHIDSCSLLLMQYVLVLNYILLRI